MSGAAGAVLMGVGGVMQLGAGWAQGEEAERQGKRAKKQYFQEAEAVKIAGREEALAKVHEAERFKASQVAAISANGGMLTGSLLRVVAESAKNYSLDVSIIGKNYMKEAINLQNMGLEARHEGLFAEKQARLGGVASLLGSSGQAYTSYEQSKGK